MPCRSRHTVWYCNICWYKYNTGSSYAKRGQVDECIPIPWHTGCMSKMHVQGCRSGHLCHHLSSKIQNPWNELSFGCMQVAGVSEGEFWNPVKFCNKPHNIGGFLVNITILKDRFEYQQIVLFSTKPTSRKFDSNGLNGCTFGINRLFKNNIIMNFRYINSVLFDTIF